MTAKEQTKVFFNIGCDEAIQEIERNGDHPLSSDRLNHHIEAAIDTGLVARVEKLAEIGGMQLTAAQAERLTKRCLQLKWIVDALCAAKLGAVSKQTRCELIKALVNNKLAEDQKEALQLLEPQ